MKLPRRTLLQGASAISLAACLPESEEKMSRPMDFQHERPIVLRSETLVQAGSDEEISAAALTNSTGEPMEIHEFVFSVRPSNAIISTGSAVAEGGNFPTGGMFAIGLSVKDDSDFGYAITNGVVPLWNFGPARQLGEESIAQAPFDDTALFYLVSTYTFKLDHPMFVPAGAKIVPSVKSLGANVSDAVVGISAIGSAYPNTPPSRPTYKVPWVCSFNSKQFAFNDYGEDVSNGNQLYNPFTDRPVHVQRFVGRINAYASYSVFGLRQTLLNDSILYSNANTGVGPTAVSNVLLLSAYSQLLSVRMRDSIGNPLVRGKTLFRNVFESQTRTWECPHILPPRQFHRVDIFKAATAEVIEIVSKVNVSVSSIGWREVTWRKS